MVDVQSARREVTITNDALKSIPTVRSYNGIVNVVPGVMTNLNDVVTTTSTTQFPIHGGRNNEGRMTVDGLNIGNPPGGNQPPAYIADVGNAQEVTFTTAGGLGESETAGLVMNIVPKTGGNSYSGAVFYSVTGEALEGSNFTPELQAAGLQTPLPLTGVYDLNGSFGGPIKKDKVWFFGNARIQGSTRGIANIYYNAECGRPDEVGIPARRRPQRPSAADGVFRSHVEQRQHARHVAGDAAQQDQRLLGRAGELPEVHGPDDRHHRSAARLA